MDMVCKQSTVTGYDIIKALVDDCNTTDPVRIREAWEARGGYVSPEYLLGALMRLKKERESK